MLGRVLVVVSVLIALASVYGAQEISANPQGAPTDAGVAAVADAGAGADVADSQTSANCRELNAAVAQMMTCQGVPQQERDSVKSVIDAVKQGWGNVGVASRETLKSIDDDCDRLLYQIRPIADCAADAVLTIGTSQPTPKLISAGKGKKRRILLSASKPGTKQDATFYFSYEQHGSTGRDIVFEPFELSLAIRSGVVNNGITGFVALVTGHSPKSHTLNKDLEYQLYPDYYQKNKTTIGIGITGSLTQTGEATETTFRAHLRRKGTAWKSWGLVDLVSLAIPIWPALPTDKLGVGARWETSGTYRLGGGVEIVAKATYELTSQDKNSVVIRRKMAISGAGSTKGNNLLIAGTVTSLSGSEDSKMTIVDGSLIPSMETHLKIQYTPSGDESPTLEIRSGVRSRDLPPPGLTRAEGDRKKKKCERICDQNSRDTGYGLFKECMDRNLRRGDFSNFDLVSAGCEIECVKACVLE